MLRRVFLSVFLFISIIQPAEAADSSARIFWAKSKEYGKIVDTLKHPPEEAHQILIDKTAKIKGLFIVSEPIFYCEGYYFFGFPEKTKSVRLSGFYVCSTSGEVEHRKSKVTMRIGRKRLPKDSFYEIRKIAGEEKVEGVIHQ